ncbi:MAG: hypothetical protein BGN88_10305 [Clostridiales bacterium 43-6]|nr:MAG: hypothetical protein BGN88_10305 [Clostridiales bacterium 43-6]
MLHSIKNFDPEEIFDCGQAFRFSETNGVWQGVAFGKVVTCKREGDTVIFYHMTEKDFIEIWYDYFTLDMDYDRVIQIISQDETLKCAAAFAKGIRILRQDPWETLCSFIISQNNNIPRIKGIIARLCETFGDEIEPGFFSFPSPDRLADLTVEDLQPLRAGFRAKYILDAAKKITAGQVEIYRLKHLPYEEAKQELLKIKGVGQKVADCALLFGCEKLEAFPEDVWIKRVMAMLLPAGLPECAREYAGIAQQYLFHYARNHNIK